MTLKVDFTEVQDFDPLPSGRYLAKVSDGEIKESGPTAKHPGSQYINWEFTIQEGDFAGRHLWTNTVIGHGSCECGDFKPNSLGSLKQLLKALDYDTTKGVKFDIPDVVGKDVALVVVQREYQGEARNDVKRILPANEYAEGELANPLMP